MMTTVIYLNGELHMKIWYYDGIRTHHDDDDDDDAQGGFNTKCTSC